MIKWHCLLIAFLLGALFGRWDDRSGYGVGLRWGKAIREFVIGRRTND